MFRLHQDLRIALRSLLKAPLTMIVTVISLGIGIGAVTSVFTLVDNLLFRAPEGLQQPERLVSLYTSRDDGTPYGRMSFPDYRDLLATQSALEDAAAVVPGPLALGEGSSVQTLLAEAVTGNYFELLGVQPVVGRAFLAEETGIGTGQPVAVISQDLWQRQFGGDSEVLGRSIRLGGQPFTVVGVAPEGSQLKPIIRTDVWVPLSTTPGSALPKGEDLDQRDERRFTVIGRLGDRATLEQLQAQLAVVGERLRQDHPREWQVDRGEERAFEAVSFEDSFINPAARPVLAALGAFLFGATGLILLIACSNVASLLLARAYQRRRETAMRIALGASQRRLMSMLLAESLLPALASAALGIVFANLAARAFGSLSLPLPLPIQFDIQLDYRVLAFASLVALIATFAAGVAPAIAGLKTDLIPSLKADSTSGGARPGRFGLRNLLVVAQVAASLVLLVGAGLFLRSVEGAANMDLGLNPAKIAVMTKTVPEAQSDPEAGVGYVRELTARLGALPEIEQVHAARSVELTVISPGESPVTLPGHETAAEISRIHFNSVTPGYLEMLAMPLMRGRGFVAGDTLGAPRVAVVNEMFAERFWPADSAIGKRFTAGLEPAGDGGEAATPRTYEVIGIVRDGKFRDIDDPLMPYFWTSLYQDFSPRFALLAQGRTGAEAILPVLRREVEVADGEVTLVPPTALARLVDIQFLHLRAASTVLGAGGGFGLLLAALGIYGILSFAVTQRRREVAIRLAIGARHRQVIRALVKDAAILTGLGLAAGLVIVLPIARLMRSQLFGMSPLDPLAIGGGIAVLLLAALAASIIPARRATAIDPIRALRED